MLFTASHTRGQGEWQIGPTKHRQRPGKATHLSVIYHLVLFAMTQFVTAQFASLMPPGTISQSEMVQRGVKVTNYVVVTTISDKV